MNGAPHDLIAGAPGRNADDARHHRHNPAIHRGVAEGTAAGREVGHAHPGQLSHNVCHKGHVIV